VTPVLLVVDADAQARAETESALARRFGSDYSVLSADSVSAGLATLERLARAGTPVVLVAADLHLPDMGGVDFLERAHQLHRDTSRVLLVTMDRHGTRIPFTELATLQRVTALGLIDMVVVKGWVTPEEWLYPQVQEFGGDGIDTSFTTWTASVGGGVKIFLTKRLFVAPEVRVGREPNVRGTVSVGYVFVGRK